MNFNHHNHHNSTGTSINTNNHNSNANLGKQRAAGAAFQNHPHQLHQHLQQQQQLSQQHQFPQQLSPQFQQLPLKTYLLNKYGQYQNSPTGQLAEQDGSPVHSPASASVLQAVISGTANNLFESVLKAPAGNSPLFNSLSSHLNNESNLIGGAIGNNLLKHHQTQQSNYISKFSSPQTSLVAQQQQQQQQSLQSNTSLSNGLSPANASLSSQLINLLELSSANNQSAASNSKANTSNQSNTKKTTKRQASNKKAPAKIDSSSSETAIQSAAKTSKNDSNNLLEVDNPLDSIQEAMATSAKRKYSGSNSSMQNSDDDDDLDESFSNAGGHNGPNSKTKEEKRRLSHTAAEQKRRNAIKRGYDDLQSIVPACEYMDPSSSQKACKATVLKRSIDYIYELEKDKEKHDEEIESLKKEIMALRIMKTNYEEMVQYHRNMPKDENTELNDETKFDLFTKFGDNLFHSFQTMVSTNSFAELSSSILNWIEHSCSANNLRNLVYLSLVQIGQQILQ